MKRTLARFPTVDIIISTYNESAHIDKCLEHVLGQDYPAESLTIWLVDGGSTDQTVIRARSWAQRDSRLRILTTRERLNLPEALNIGIEHSSSELIAKIDAHGYPETDFISRAVKLLMEDESLKCVGGRPVQEGATWFGEALACARRSPVGVGGSGYAGTTESQYVETVQCGVYRREALDKVGWFDPSMNFAEDDELNWRLTEHGYRILLDTRIRFHYVTRPNWGAAYRQYRNYGRARVWVVRKHPRYLRLYHLAPAAFFLTLGALAVGAIFLVEARYALASIGTAYLGVLLLEAVRVAEVRLALAPWIVSAFLALHLGYAVGMLKELVSRTLDGLRARFLRRGVVESPFQ